MVNSYNTEVYKTADNIYTCEARDGQVIAESSSTPETVFQAAFDRAGDIKIHDGDYYMSNGFSGIKPKSLSRIFGTRRALLWVPSGYTGDVILFDTAYNSGNTISHIELDGLYLRENGATSYNWTGIHLLSSGDLHGISQVKLKNTLIYYPSHGVKIELGHTGAWINDNEIDCVYNGGSRVGVEFIKPVGTPYNSINRWNFRRMTHQASSITTYGFKAIDGEGHYFDDVRCYDWQVAASGAKISQFLPTANKIMITQGIMTGAQSPTAFQYMDWQCPRSNITVIDPFITPSIVGTNEGIYTYPSSNDGKTRTYNIPHNLGVTPTLYDVFPITKDAGLGPFSQTANSTNIVITYTNILPPPTTAGNPNNLKWYWRARA